MMIGESKYFGYEKSEGYVPSGIKSIARIAEGGYCTVLK